MHTITTLPPARRPDPAVTFDAAAVQAWFAAPSEEHPRLSNAEAHGVCCTDFGRDDLGFLSTVENILYAGPTGLDRRADVEDVLLWQIPDDDLTDQGALITVDLLDGVRLATQYQDRTAFADRGDRGIAAMLSALSHIAVQASALVDAHLPAHTDPHPANAPSWPACRQPPAGRWRPARLEVHGLTGSYPGQFVTNHTVDGWLTVRFTRAVAEQIATAVDALTDHPAHLDRLRIVDSSADAVDPDERTTVGVDADGCWRVGAGWRWVSPDLAPPGRLLPYPGPSGPTALHDTPALGQDIYVSPGCLMWLDRSGDLLLRDAGDNGGFDRSGTARPPAYGSLPPAAAQQFRAVEHLLRGAVELRRRLAPIASRFTTAEIEELLVAAADAVPATTAPISDRRRDITRRARAAVERTVGREQWS